MVKPLIYQSKCVEGVSDECVEGVLLYYEKGCCSKFVQAQNMSNWLLGNKSEEYQKFIKRHSFVLTGTEEDSEKIYAVPDHIIYDVTVQYSKDEVIAHELGHYYAFYVMRWKKYINENILTTLCVEEIPTDVLIYLCCNHDYEANMWSEEERRKELESRYKNYVYEGIRDEMLADLHMAKRFNMNIEKYKNFVERNIDFIKSDFENNEEYKSTTEERKNVINMAELKYDAHPQARRLVQEHWQELMQVGRI